MTIQVRPEVNPLTTPESYRLRNIPRAVIGNNELAAKIALRNPIYNEGLGKGFLLELVEVLKEELINGNQIKIEDLCTCCLSFSGRMDAPDDPLPSPKESLQVKLYPSRKLVKAVRQVAQLERLPMSEKLPVITSAEDTVLGLNNVLNNQGLLKISGVNLLFAQDDEESGCIIEGTRNGRAVQTRFGLLANTELIVLPDIPSQTEPWNNEYMVSIKTRYTENGSIRTGIYRRRLRTPLGVYLGSGDGILSNGGTTRLVTVTGGTLTAEGTRVRIQAVLDAQDGDLHFSLLDMKEQGAVGDKVRVSANGTYTLTGYAGSALTSLEVQVNEYAALLKMVRNPYGGRLVDILDISGGS
jgi:hypothetical protein